MKQAFDSGSKIIVMEKRDNVFLLDSKVQLSAPKCLRGFTTERWYSPSYRVKIESNAPKFRYSGTAHPKVKFQLKASQEK